MTTSLGRELYNLIGKLVLSGVITHGYSRVWGLLDAGVTELAEPTLLTRSWRQRCSHSNQTIHRYAWTGEYAWTSASLLWRYKNLRDAPSGVVVVVAGVVVDVVVVVVVVGLFATVKNNDFTVMFCYYKETHKWSVHY